jgi:hypothetical protein
MGSKATLLAAGMLCAVIASASAKTIVSDNAGYLQGAYTNVALAADGDAPASDDATRYKVASASQPASVEYSSSTATYDHIEVSAYFDLQQAASVSLYADSFLAVEVTTADVQAAVSNTAGLGAAFSAVLVPGSQWASVHITQGLDDLCNQVVKLSFTGTAKHSDEQPASTACCSNCVCTPVASITTRLEDVADKRQQSALESCCN